MNKTSVLRSSVIFFVTFAVLLEASANGPSCGRLLDQFDSASSLNTAQTYTNRISFMQTSVHEGLKQLRLNNPSRDHLSFLAEQVPLVLGRLNVYLNEATTQLESKKIQFNREELETLRTQAALKSALSVEIEAIRTEANEVLGQQRVTYQWYMNFFLKALLVSDVAARISNENGSNKIKEDHLILRLRGIHADGKTFFSNNLYETAAYSALSSKFFHLIAHANYMEHRHRYTLIPVLFKPESQEALRAEILGARLVSLSGTVRETQEGRLYPLEYAGWQVMESIRIISPSKFK